MKTYYLDHLSVEEQLKLIWEKDLRYLFFTSNEEIHLLSVRKETYTFRFIREPSEKVQLEAVQNDGMLLQFIRNPSEKIQLKAVQNNGDAIQFINNPSEKILEKVAKDLGIFPPKSRRYLEKGIKLWKK